MSTDQVFDVDNDDSDFTSKSNADSNDDDDDDDDNSTMGTMSDSELVTLYKDQLINVHELLGSSDDDDTDDDREERVAKKELVDLYKDQSVPIQELAPVSNVEAPYNSNIYSIARKVSLGPYFIKFSVPVAAALAYVEPIFRQSRDNGSCVYLNTTAVLVMKTLCLVFILCAPVTLMNYRYTLKINALMHDIIVELQTKRERHVKYPHVYPSAAVSATHIRSTIVNPTQLSTFEDWQCVLERLDAHPLLRKSMKEEKGDFIEYWEILI